MKPVFSFYSDLASFFPFAPSWEVMVITVSKSLISHTCLKIMSVIIDTSLVSIEMRKCIQPQWIFFPFIRISSKISDCERKYSQKQHVHMFEVGIE